MVEEIKLWSGNKGVIIPSELSPKEIVAYGKQLNDKDRDQIVKAFEVKNYQMLSNYVWSKSISALKNQLSKMGVGFIGEMLDRSDINESSNLNNVITDYEVLKLAEELGIINTTNSMRLRHQMELLYHFNNPDVEDLDNEFNRNDAENTLRYCIQAVLGSDRIEFALDFRKFRDALEKEQISKGSEYYMKLIQSPYFFHRATLRIITGLIKTSNSAQLENCLANANVLIPSIWENLKQPDKYLFGKTYAELNADGKTTAASGVRKVLLKVKGFDFVPEDLRSNSFIKVANEMLEAHQGLNNFYNEPAPTLTLYSMGSTIPIPAFPICMSATLSIKIGNRYNVSYTAADTAKKILDRVTPERWQYFFEECLPIDDLILYKLDSTSPLDYWIDYFSDKEEILNPVHRILSDKDLKDLVKGTISGKKSQIRTAAENLRKKLGSI